MRLEIVYSLDSISASSTDLKKFKLHTFVQGFQRIKTSTTRCLGCRVQVWVPVLAPDGNLVVTPEGRPRQVRCSLEENALPLLQYQLSLRVKNFNHLKLCKVLAVSLESRNHRFFFTEHGISMGFASMLQTRIAAKSWPLALFQNSGSQGFILRVKPLSALDCHWRNPRKKNYREHSFYACRIVVLWLLRLNIKASHDIPKFLIANLWSIHLLAFYIDWSWKISLLTFFAQCSLSCSSTVNLEKVRTENLKSRTDLWDPVVDGWSVTQ